MNELLPKVQQPVTDGRGFASREWYSFFRSMSGLDGATLQAEIAALAERVAALEDGESLTFNGAQSITVTNVDGVVTVSLAGDNDSPGGNWYYGTNTDGVRGFWPIADGVSGGYSITKAVDYGPYDFQGELDSPDELPYPVVVDDAYLINGDLWAGVDEGEPDDPGWDNLGPAPTITILSLVNDEETPAPTHYYGTDAAGDKGWHDLSLNALSDVDAPSPANGQVLAFDSGEWKPSFAGATAPFNYISADGDIYVTEDGADLYIGY